jgi:hypothetical protein
MKSIYHDCKAAPAVYPQSLTGVAHVHDAGVDTAGYEGVAFILACGAIAGGALVSFKAQSCATDTDGSYVDIAGATVTFTDAEDNKVAIIDVNKPILRWVRCVCTNGAAFAALVSVVGILYGPRIKPVTQVGPAGVSVFVTEL